MKLSMKAARVNAGLTQVDVAHALGINRETLRRYENDPGRMPFAMMRKFTALTNVDINDIIEVSDKIVHNPQDGRPATDPHLD